MTPDCVSSLIVTLILIGRTRVSGYGNFNPVENGLQTRSLIPILIEQPLSSSDLVKWTAISEDYHTSRSSQQLDQLKQNENRKIKSDESYKLSGRLSIRRHPSNSKSRVKRNPLYSIKQSLYGSPKEQRSALRHGMLPDRVENTSRLRHLLKDKTTTISVKIHPATSNIEDGPKKPGMQNTNEILNANLNSSANIGKFSRHAPIVTPLNGKYTSYSLKNDTIFDQFMLSLDQFERKLYETTFIKLSSSSPPERQENGISFVQSGLFLHLLLMAFCSEVDQDTRMEIEKCLKFTTTDTDIVDLIKRVISTLPESSDDLKFRWSSRLVLGLASPTVSQGFRTGPASALRLHLDQLNGTETPEVLVKILNNMLEVDSGGAMRNTFDEEDVLEGSRAALLSLQYVRARWRTAPTLLNGTRAFRDAAAAPPRAVRMIRINDVMRYADLTEWDAEAVEISYATPGLSLLLLLPRGRSLRVLAGRVAAAGVRGVAARMRRARLAATLPLFTLRMTLLLPDKLQAMGISRLLDASNAAAGLRLSHAVQRLMFWSEAGRNAFKDDGIEWDDPPEAELLVDRPYIFFVRWRNITLMNGNFVL